jgi:hypothetical protein
VLDFHCIFPYRHAEFHVDGVHAGGNVDWAIVYKKFNIVVVEVSVRS